MKKEKKKCFSRSTGSETLRRAFMFRRCRRLRETLSVRVNNRLSQGRIPLAAGVGKGRTPPGGGRKNGSPKLTIGSLWSRRTHSRLPKFPCAVEAKTEAARSTGAPHSHHKCWDAFFPSPTALLSLSLFCFDASVQIQNGFCSRGSDCGPSRCPRQRVRIGRGFGTVRAKSVH